MSLLLEQVGIIHTQKSPTSTTQIGLAKKFALLKFGGGGGGGVGKQFQTFLKKVTENFINVFH